ncbi:ABC transporter permease [Legionella longbeachae]|uniref:Putative ABC transporter, permease protein n=1 Tax=Legionella longbeachae serogroup 1 (strain NSW150) TaxID=661367 RepID=D3HPF9_LEGLN|nr:ABC transporter permease [Legionella longbeachae]VEE01299.1 ABC transporter permease [Legionella oakridgensis]HBD7398265.1 ABC transporter permease [Legionella pneumophila]ARB92336.1 ABC transporter permease [Legionella longbeachae]ARM34483.1 ABC transporter permease [Legionella longbeachae]EEZ96224.1 ABC-2 type transporter [Legionella longbeachae D-4968]
MKKYQNLVQGVSIARIAGLIRKEFILITRDRGTIAMLVILPIMLLILFGFAIEFDPKHLPTSIVSYDNSPLTRSYVSALEASGYFKVIDGASSENQKNQDLANGKISFAFTIPSNFTRKYIRNENPQLLVEIDGSDPGSSASALGNALPILSQTLNSFNKQGLGAPTLGNSQRNVNLTIHRLYNESNTSSYNIVPGLIGVLLTLTMVMLTSTAITSEKESGTMEMLLSTPLKPTEIILGKVIPYIVLGYLQLTSILIFGKLLINIPTEGSLVLLYVASAPFIVANLMVGMIYSTIARTPMQAMQLSVFYQLPSMFLSGYIFSFYGMPVWAQMIGYCIPMTYFIRITRGILLKGNTVSQIIPNILPILFIALILVLLTGKIFRTKLD